MPSKYIPRPRKPKYPAPSQEPTAVDWARLAAFIDGEGCIRITEKKMEHWPRPYMYLQLTIANTDPKLPIWLKETFGGGVHHSERGKKLNKNWSDCFSWMVSCRRVEEILLGCMPYFIIKRDQAETAIAFSKTIKRGVGSGRTKSTPPEVIEQQHQFKVALSELKGRASRRPGWQERNKDLEQVSIPDGLVLDTLVN